MLTWLVVLALLWPLFWCLRLLLVTRVLMGLQWRRALAEPVALESLPPHVREAAAPWIARLEAVGFCLWGGVRLSSTAEAALDEFVVVLGHGAQPVRAVISFKSEATLAGQCAVSFRSTGTDGSEWVTSNYVAEAVLPLVPGVEVESVATPVMEELLRRHLVRMSEASSPWWRCPDLASAARREGQVLDAIVDHARRSGLLVEESPGVFRCTAASAVRRGAAVLREAAKKKRQPAFSTPGIPELSAVSLTEFDLQHYRQMVALQRGKFSLRAKAVLGAVSFAVFAAVLAWQYSWTVAATLVVALVFHEGGHLLAMRLFGHRDLQLLFIPFFGGAAVSMDDRVLRPWQHIVIILAGPLPGIFVAIAMFAYAAGADVPAWFNEAATTTLVLNVFNLLPVLPLDGGQIVDYAVAARFPRARVAFLALSALGMLLLGTVLGGVKLLVGVGVAALIRLPAEWRLAAVNRAVREEFPQGGEEEPVVRSVLAHLRAPEWAKTPMSQRLGLVRGLQNTLRMPRPGFGTICFAALGFTAPLWLGLPLFLWAGIRQGEAREAKAEARAIAAGFKPMSATRPAAPKIAAADNAAVLLARASELNKDAFATAREGSDERVVALLREAARKPAYEPLQSPAASSAKTYLLGGSDVSCVHQLVSAAEEKLRYRESHEAVELAIDVLRLGRLMESAPERLQWDMHLFLNSRAWSVIEDALAAGAVLSPEDISELRRLANEDALVAAAAVAIPESSWRQAQLMRQTATDEQGFWWRVLFRIQGASREIVAYRERAFDEAVRAKARLKDLSPGHWPKREKVSGPGASADLALMRLGDHVAQLRMARVAIAAAEVRQRGGVVTSLESLGLSRAQVMHPYTLASVHSSRRGSFWVLEFVADKENDSDDDDNEAQTKLVWRIPVDAAAARK